MNRVIVFLVGCALIFASKNAGAQLNQKQIDAIWRSIKTTRADSTLSGAYYLLGKHYALVNPDSALLFAQRSLTFAKKSPLLYLGKAHYLVAVSHKILSQYDKMPGHLDKAI